MISTTTTTTKKDNTAVTDIIFYVHEKQSLVKHEINQVWLFLQFQHTSQDAKQDTVTGCLVSTKHRETAFRHLGFIVFDSWQRTNKVHRPIHLRSRIKAVQQQIVFWCHISYCGPGIRDIVLSCFNQSTKKKKKKQPWKYKLPRSQVSLPMNGVNVKYRPLTVY